MITFVVNVYLYALWYFSFC